MYGARVAVGPLVVGAGVGKLAATGSSVGGYLLVALGLLTTGLLLTRLGHAGAGRPPASRGREPVVRALLTLAVAGIGATLIVCARGWRSLETSASAHTIHLVTNQPTVASPSAGVLVLYHGAMADSVLALSSECTVAYLVASLLIGGAPLLLVRRLSAFRTIGGLVAAVAVLEAVNLVRLTAIGAAVSSLGQTGFAIAHTYLGSVLTFVGTCLAGVAFAFVLLKTRGVAAPDLSD